MMLNRLAQRMRCSKWGKKVAEVVEAHAARSPEESAVRSHLSRKQAQKNETYHSESENRHDAHEDVRVVLKPSFVNDHISEDDAR
jgi:hypothetical protein